MWHGGLGLTLKTPAFVRTSLAASESRSQFVLWADFETSKMAAVSTAVMLSPAEDRLITSLPGHVGQTMRLRILCLLMDATERRATTLWPEGTWIAGALMLRVARTTWPNSPGRLVGGLRYTARVRLSPVPTLTSQVERRSGSVEPSSRSPLVRCSRTSKRTG